MVRIAGPPAARRSPDTEPPLAGICAKIAIFCEKTSAGPPLFRISSQKWKTSTHFWFGESMTNQPSVVLQSIPSRRTIFCRHSPSETNRLREQDRPLARRPMALFKLICPLLLAICTAAPAVADTLFNVNFDDLDASAGDLDLGGISPYQGLTWSNFFAYTSTPGFPGFNNGIVSLDNAAYSGGEFFGATVMPVVGTITAASPFDFVSGNLGAGYYDDLNVTVEGFLGGNMLFSQTVTVGTSGAQLFNFNFTGIDELDLFGVQTASTTDPFSCGTFNCTQFTLDDATFSTSASSPVPEPSSLSLLSLGMLGLLAATRRYRRT